MLMVLLLLRQGSDGKTAGGGGTVAAVKTVRVLAAEMVANFHQVITHHCLSH